ncbi:AraC family transcriptional regulator [Phocaeicola plebeius]|uniref:AraC family transcriptional regulator n=1 Tax=Phocaeicola plebeius TaxID=310297 RepID=A0A415ITW2_9BACT|nr:AraC family transcriptional regulator [Phocaeicola plebeius]RHK91856.1 AraC family transcriptional regulator [Phocaeicola plebeius]RHL11080.1 AraC family transcriptional regulator [Phocaeicola plebeius]
MNLQVEQMHPLVLNVGLAVHNADWNWKNVNSPFTRLYYVTEGSAQIELPDGIYTLSPKHMYFIPAFTIHTNICKSNFIHYYLHIYEDHYSDNDWLDHWKFPVEIEATDLDLALFKRLCEINPHMTLQKSDPTTYDNNPTLMQNLIKNRQRAFCDKVESRGVVFQLLSRFFKQGQSKIEMEDNRIAKTVLYIRKHLNEAIELEKLAEISCLSKDHFIRLFKKELGTTPLQYINQKKIEKAQLLLITEELAVKEIAFQLAFEDYSYFNRLFKKITGVTPQEYRRLY